MRARKTWEFTFEELLDAPVQRKHLHIEWLTKLSTKEFKEWSTAVVRILRFTNSDEAVVQDKLWEEIERKEKGYVLTREKLALEAKMKTQKIKLARFSINSIPTILFHIPVIEKPLPVNIVET